ncbi:peptidase, M1 family protein [Thioalkalivibrio nitratireducens DSM 14787]|uniref:Peptidase, M1 family protein n=1 Tax=Thioalkalivibrio nitratireducens (strain DSM 14787 / UNIQEM 213 / ALEN2) TaxID=1255043 RepID=L0DTZ3_THIND|nr:M1 family aminopeptidase [Thioalkalivibrio nitratireducens]AGA33064.1 peptidase, M1 family protein [Thioalkalivibrio nitratireducens DSM 14787]
MRADRRSWLLLLTVLQVLLLLTATASAAPPALNMDVHLDPDRGTVDGELSVDLPAGDHRFRLDAGLEPAHALIGGHQPQVSHAGGDRYRIHLPEAGILHLGWQGEMPTDTRGFLAPDGGFLPPDAGWYPRFDGMDVFRLRIRVRVPDHQRAVATGSLLGEPELQNGRRSSVYEHPRTDGIVVATGPWQERTMLVNGVRVRTLFPESLDAAHASTYLDHTAEYLAMFSERAGPYPYQSFTIAASPMPVGFAFPGFTLLGERVIPLPFIPRTSLAHELMHSWWGTGVRVDYPTGNWSEALTTFMADYHLDELHGRDRETRYRWLLDLAALPPQLDRPLVSFRGGNQGATRIVGYNRGALMFHMLREKIGAADFDKGARLLRDRHLFEEAGWTDLADAFSDAAGQDLRPFFTTWVNRPGLPELALHSVSQARDVDRWTLNAVLEQVQSEPPWPLRVPVVIDTRDGPHRSLVTLDERRSTFSVDLDAPATAVTADPDFELLRRLSNPPPILRTASLHPDTRLLTTQDGLEPFARAILNRSPERAEAFREDAPLLVIGGTRDVADWMARTGIAEPAPGIARSGHARMWTLPGTRTVVVSANDAAGLQTLTRMLQHHGHRSYLVLDADGRTLEAGVWATDTEPLRVDLSPVTP